MQENYECILNKKSKKTIGSSAIRMPGQCHRHCLHRSGTAKANGLNPGTNLNHLLTVLSEQFAADPQASIDDLFLD